MLRSYKELIDYDTLATDGTIGKVADMMVDENGWIIRYLVIDPGDWLAGRKLLINPSALGAPDWAGRALPGNVSRESVKESPALSLDEPIMRKYESRLHEHYGWSPYWLARVPEGRSLKEEDKPDRPKKYPDEENKKEPAGPEATLWSAETITGYALFGNDTEYGRLNDLLYDDQDWNVRYLCVSLSAADRKKTVLVPRDVIVGIQSDPGRVTVSVGLDDLSKAPEYDAAQPVDTNTEAHVIEHYRQAGG